MSTAIKSKEKEGLKLDASFEHLNIGFVVSKYYSDITFGLLEGAKKVLSSYSIGDKNQHTLFAPGTFEIPLVAQRLASQPGINAVICLGCVIQGETKHFDFICDAVAKGTMDISLKYNKPVAFGVITANTLEQAKDRAGGKLGNKGEEAALAVLHLLSKESNLQTFDQ